MRELLALVKTNFQIQKNIFFDGDKQKVTKKVLSMIFMVALLIASMEFYVSNALDISRVNYGVALIFNCIIFAELFVIIIFSCYRIINLFYLANDWKDIAIYPLKSGVLLLSKCIIICYQCFVASVFFLIPLLTYGVLTHSNILYYVQLILIQIVISVIPTIYITLISLTILWLITVFMKSKSENKDDKFIILVDTLVGLLTYFMIDNISNTIFILTISVIIIVLSFFSFYFIGGNVYLTIVKSEVFQFKHTKKIETDITRYEFKVRNPIKSNVIRDVKMIIRTPALMTNYVSVNIVLNIIIFILIIIFNRSLMTVFHVFDWANSSIFIGMCMWLMSAFSMTSLTSFSREGSGLKSFSIFPLGHKNYLLSKIYVGILSYVPNLICFNLLILIISRGLNEFILYELVLVSYLMAIVLISIKTDSEDMNLGWINIKELFEIEKFMKQTIPLNIFMILHFIYLFVGAFIFHFQSGGVRVYLGVFFILLVNIILSIWSLRKIKINMGVKHEKTLY